MVRIHSPRPLIFRVFIVFRRLKPFGLQPLFRHCAQNCAYSAHFERVPSPPALFLPAGEHTGASWRNRCGPLNAEDLDRSDTRSQILPCLLEPNPAYQGTHPLIGSATLRFGQQLAR